jgi:hypothetical protein
MWIYFVYSQMPQSQVKRKTFPLELLDFWTIYNFQILRVVVMNFCFDGSFQELQCRLALSIVLAWLHHRL